MKKLVLSAILIALVLSAGTAFGQNKVYIPLVLDQEVDGTAYETEIRIVKKGEAGAGDFSYLFIPANEDGTTFDREAAIADSVNNNATVRLDGLVDPGDIGFMEFDVPADVAVTSRLFATDLDGNVRLGSEIPSVTGMSGGETAILGGLQRNTKDRLTDFYLLNLSEDDNQCEINVAKRGGSAVTTEAMVIQPQTLVPFQDLFGLLDQTGADLSIAVTCDQTFHSYAVVTYRDSAETLYITDPRSGGGVGGGVGGSGGGGIEGCSADAEVVREGVVHRPTASNERGGIDIPFNGGEIFSKIIVELDVTMSGWHNRSGDQHNIFWLQNTNVWRGNLYGYLNVRGPNRNRVKNNTNVGLSAGDFAIIETDRALQTGVTYHVYYEYNTQLGEVKIIFTRKDTGAEVLRMTGGTTVGAIRVKSPNFFIKFGHTSHEAGPEVPTFGWTYANVCVDFQ